MVLRYQPDRLVGYTAFLFVAFTLFQRTEKGVIDGKEKIEGRLIDLTE